MRRTYYFEIKALYQQQLQRHRHKQHNNQTATTTTTSARRMKKQNREEREQQKHQRYQLLEEKRVLRKQQKVSKQQKQFQKYQKQYQRQQKLATLGPKKLAKLLRTAPVRAVQYCTQNPTQVKIMNWSEQRLCDIEFLTNTIHPATITPFATRAKHYDTFVAVAAHYRECQQAIATTASQFSSYLYANHLQFVAPTIQNIAQYKSNIMYFIYQCIKHCVNKMDAIRASSYQFIGERVYQLPRYQQYQHIYEELIKLHEQFSSPRV